MALVGFHELLSLCHQLVIQFHCLTAVGIGVKIQHRFGQREIHGAKPIQDFAAVAIAAIVRSAAVISAFSASSDETISASATACSIVCVISVGIVNHSDILPSPRVREPPMAYPARGKAFLFPALCLRRRHFSTPEWANRPYPEENS